MIVYFSGTGNSRFVAHRLAAQLGDALTDAGPLIKQGGPVALHSETPWVFVAPVYAWRMAKVFEDFLHTAELQGSRLAYFLLTCGSDMGGAARALRPLCEAKGLRQMGVMPVVMPENYLAMFPVPNRGQSLRIIHAALPGIREAGERIALRRPLPAPRRGLLDAVKSGPVNRGFYRHFVSAEGFRVTESCVSCGACTERCVLNNIRLVDGRPVWGEACTHCMACICHCPAGAIEYKKRTVGKRRYTCIEPQDNLAKKS